MDQEEKNTKVSPKIANNVIPSAKVPPSSGPPIFIQNP